MPWYSIHFMSKCLKLSPGGKRNSTGGKTTGIVLTLEKDNTIKLNQESVPLDILETRLTELFRGRQDKTIFIRADKSIVYREVLRVIDIAKGAGVEVLGVMTQVYESSQ